MVSNQGPSAYQPNASPLGQIGSFSLPHLLWDFTSVPTGTFSGGNTGVEQNKWKNSEAAGFAFLEFSVTVILQAFEGQCLVKMSRAKNDHIFSLKDKSKVWGDF